eukprot:c22801_g1_i1 orf=120-1838(+)
MAHLFRLKLQALYCPRLLSSPALSFKLLNSPDPRHIPRRWYGESALLEESCNSTQNASDINGVSNQGEDLTKQGNRIEDKVSNRASTASKLSSLDMDKLTSSISDKLKAKPTIKHDEKGKGVQTQVDRLSTNESNKSIKDDKWQQLVSNVRTMALKTKSKAAAGDKSGLPKMEQTENQHDFADLDLPQAKVDSGISRGPNDSNKDSLVMTAFGGKNPKQKNTQSQSPNLQKSKDTKPLSFSFLKSHDATEVSSVGNDEDFFSGVKPQDSSSQYTNQIRNKDAIPGWADYKLSRGKDSASSRASQESNHSNQPRSKDAMQVTFDSKLSRSTNDTFSTAEMQGRIPSNTSEATHQPSNNRVSHTGYMVCVQNLPASSNPAQIKASMAMHGEVLGFFKKTVRNDCLNVYIQFKTAEGMEGALAARKLQIGGKAFLIVRTDSVFTTVVRLSKVSLDTSESQLHLICGRYGSIDSIKERASGIFDVFYKVKELPNMTNILGSLNQVMHNRSTWFALPAPILHPTVQKDALKSTEGQAWHELQSYQAKNRIRSALDNVSVLLEDLEELNVLAKEYSKR